MREDFSERRLWLRSLLAGLTILALLGFVGFELARHANDSGATPKVGQMAPGFTLPDRQGKTISLADVLSTSPISSFSAAHSPKAVFIVFYRGYW